MIHNKSSKISSQYKKKTQVCKYFKVPLLIVHYTLYSERIIQNQDWISEETSIPVAMAEPITALISKVASCRDQLRGLEASVSGPG